MIIRPYQEEDFPAIHQWNKEQGWDNLVEKQQETKTAWKNSNAAFVTEIEGRIAGCLRGLTDGNITLYICELLVDQNHRGKGIGTKLMDHVHGIYPGTRLELLASSTSCTFYESQKFRAFYGFRKTFSE